MSERPWREVYERAIELSFFHCQRAARLAAETGLYGEQLDLEQILLELARLQESSANGRRLRRLRTGLTPVADTWPPLT